MKKYYDKVTGFNINCKQFLTNPFTAFNTHNAIIHKPTRTIPRINLIEQIYYFLKNKLPKIFS